VAERRFAGCAGVDSASRWQSFDTPNPGRGLQYLPTAIAGLAARKELKTAETYRDLRAESLHTHIVDSFEPDETTSRNIPTAYPVAGS